MNNKNKIPKNQRISILKGTMCCKVPFRLCTFAESKKRYTKF